MPICKKKPFPVQSEVVKGVVKSFQTGNSAVYITAEMGSGKTLMGIATALLLKEKPRVLVLCPPHLVRKWVKEIKDSVPLVNVFNLNGKNCLSMLERLKTSRQPTRPEFYVIGRERAKTTYQWRPAVIVNQRGMFCPSCGGMLLDQDEVPLPIFDRNNQGKIKKKYACQNSVIKWKWDPEIGSHSQTYVKCGEQLWQADAERTQII